MVIKKSATAAGEGTVVEEFGYLAIDQIVFTEQIRSPEDEAGEEFLGLVESVRDQGVIEPVVVAPQIEPVVVAPQIQKYDCLAGERRIRAARAAGLTTVPVRIIRGLGARERIAVQVTENLHRKDLDALDQGAAFMKFFRVCHGEVTVGEVLNHFITYERDAKRLETEVAETVSAIVKISGKTSRSAQNIISLQILPPEVREAIKTRKLTVSQGYVFAANVGHPGFTEILAEALNGTMSSDALEKRFKDYGKAKLGRPVQPAAVCLRRVGDLRKFVEETGRGMTAEELFNLLEEINSVGELVANLKEEVEAAAAAEREKEAGEGDSGQCPEPPPPAPTKPKKRIA